MTRMIERWFPCAEVSTNSNSGWGSGNTERNLFTWFAARPTAQAKAAVICSLLPWPDNETEQQRLQNLVRHAMTGRYMMWEELRNEILKANSDGASVLDSFSGRGMIPLEAARLGLPSYGIEYSPVATLASHLLADYPFRDWSSEPELPFGDSNGSGLYDTRPRLLRDVSSVLDEIGRRWVDTVAELYPSYEGNQPWGYMWAVTLPCQECGHRFPLVGRYELRRAGLRKDGQTGTRIHDPGQSYFIQGDAASGEFRVVIHDGSPSKTPILANALDPNGKKIRGKAAVCPHCGHTHAVKTHQRLAGEGLGRDALLLVADLDPTYGKFFRLPSEAEQYALQLTDESLNQSRRSPPLSLRCQTKRSRRRSARWFDRNCTAPRPMVI